METPFWSEGLSKSSNLVPKAFRITVVIFFGILGVSSTGNWTLDAETSYCFEMCSICNASISQIELKLKVPFSSFLVLISYFKDLTKITKNGKTLEDFHTWLFLTLTHKLWRFWYSFALEDTFYLNIFWRAVDNNPMISGS